MAGTANVPPPPPRATGNAQTDAAALAQWANDFYTAAVRGGYFLNVQEQSQGGSFDPASLPDPASTTLAQAQTTANEAYAKAVAAGDDANRIDNWYTGTATVTGASASIAVTFPGDKQQPDATYKVFLSVVSFTGTPGLGAFVPVSTTLLATTGFTLTVQAAPGLGNSVTFNVFIVRTI
jgi:hypothetical protein